MGIIFLAGCSGLQFPAADASQAETSAEYAWETSKLKDDPIWADPQSVKAMIISDLHYTEYKEVDPVLVPGIALAGEITDTIAAEVIDRHPDVLIMTGDNTNSGYIRDVAGLVPKLQKIKENGIPIIITTGNHDFDLMDSGEFEKAYFELLDPVDRDPASLSYTAIVKDVVFWQWMIMPWSRELGESFPRRLCGGSQKCWQNTAAARSFSSRITMFSTDMGRRALRRT